MIGAPALRLASAGDAAAIAALNGELGYPSVPDEVTARLAAIEASAADAVLVAEQRGRVIGWAHVALKPSLLDVASAQLMGLVVAEGERSAGIGRALLIEAEGWARARGARRMVVASRVTRERAHRFYEREGYAILKRSFIFEKRLDEDP
jgi:GNAT superfamily N-acetyltransferase